VAVAEAGDRGFKNPARGFTLARLELILISSSKSLSIINLSLRLQFGEASMKYVWQYGVWMSFWHFQNFGKSESG
jgi:hypothetical protein